MAERLRGAAPTMERLRSPAGMRMLQLLPATCLVRCRGNRLAGGASKSGMTPVNKSSPKRILEREVGGGCPPPNCTTVRRSIRHDAPNADCSSISSSCCPTRCGGHPRVSPSRRFTASADRPSCASSLRAILKRRDLGCGPNGCLCQPMPRSCNCPLPVRVDARAVRDCSCECPSSPECACPPSERRFSCTRASLECPNARPRCPRLRSPRDLEYRYARSSRSPPSCEPCASLGCRTSAPRSKTPCQHSPCQSCYSSCQPVPIASTASPPCRLSTPCEKLTFCTDKTNRSLSPCAQLGVSCTSAGTTSTYAQTHQGKNGSVLSNLGDHSSALVPSPLALIFFTLLILLAVSWSSALSFYRRCLPRRRICWKYLRL